jgi:GT2 family glycosyltransferase
MELDLSIIIVTYNSEKHIFDLINSIKKSKDNLNKEIIIIDNFSQDETVKILKQNSREIQLIESKINLGFSRAVNLGIKQSKGQYILLLNPDTKIKNTCLEKMVRFARENESMGAMVPRLVDPNGKPQASAFHFPSINNAIRAYFFNQKEYFGKYLPPNRITNLDIAVMAAFLIPKKTIEKIGLLNEKYFLYYEDIDYCRRLKKHKLSLYYLPSAKVIHIHGASGHFKSHLNSPLAKSAIIYHGQIYFFFLNLILQLGQKWQKLIKYQLR